MILKGDVVLALSYSGETEEIVALAPHVKRRGARSPRDGTAASTLGRSADIVVTCRIREEACPLNLAPTASTTAQMAMATLSPWRCRWRRGSSGGLRRPASGRKARKALLRVAT